MKIKEETNLSSLHEEMLVHVFSFFNKRELALAGEVNKTFYKLSKDEQLQKKAPWPKLDYTKPLPNKSLVLSNKEALEREVECLTEISKGRLVSGCFNGKISIWDTRTSECIKVLTGHTYVVTFVAELSEDIIVSAAMDHTLRVWDIKSGECLKRIETGKQSPASGLVLSENLVVLGSHVPWENNRGGDGTLQIWNLDSGESEILHQYTSSIICLKKLSHNKMVCSFSDGTLQIWDYEKKASGVSLSGHENLVKSVDMLNDEKIVSASHDGTIRIWNSETGDCLKSFKHSKLKDNWIKSIAVSEDGTIITSTYSVINFWNSDTYRLINSIPTNSTSANGLRNAIILEDGRIAYGTHQSIHILSFAFLKPTLDKVQNQQSDVVEEDDKRQFSHFF